MTTPTPFSIAAASIEGVSVLRPIGVLDQPAGIDLRNAIEAALVGRQPALVIDLSSLRYVASAGIAVLVQTHKRLRPCGGGLHLAQPSDAVSEVLTVLNLGAIIPLHATVGDAVRATRASSAGAAPLPA